MIDLTDAPTRTPGHAGERSRYSPARVAATLNDLAPVSAVRRAIAQAIACTTVGLLRVAASLAGLIGAARRRRVAERPARVVLTGMFVSDGWVEAHVRPLAASPACGHCWVVTDRPMLALPKVTYVCPPAWLQRLIGRVPSRSLLCVWTALRTRADVVGGFHLIFNGMFALIAARLLGARSVYFCVGGASEIWGGGARSETSLFHRMGRDVPWLERQLLWFIRRIDVTLTMGSGARGYLRDRGVTQPIVIMSGGIDAGRYVGRIDPREREFDLVFVGRLVPIKRTDILLQVLAGVAAARPQLRAAIVGDGPLREEMEREVRRLGLERNVHFAGHQSEVASWLHRARVFILTSDSEGLALSLMEAMMAGLPAVVSDVGDLGDIVNDGVNGYLPARRDVPAFVERIVGLLADPERYAVFSAAARAAAEAYSIECGSRRWSELLTGWGFAPGGSSAVQS